MERIVVDYFESIFRSNGSKDARNIVEVIQPVVTDSMNVTLSREFSAMEMKKAPKKTPGFDGMPPIFFFQHYWSIVGNYVIKIVLDFLDLVIITPKFNETLIVLIPEVKNPTKITQYRPISLSNVVSRFASKVLANRLKTLFPHIISENQSALMST